MENAIEAAVLPLKSDALARAEQEARKLIEKVRTELEAGDWDINAVASWPKNIWAHDYKAQCARTKLFQGLTKNDPAKGYQISNGRDPLYVVMNDAAAEKLVESLKAEAAAQYDAFVAKLTTKIGEVETAELAGNHVWGYSVLTVTKADGSVERWKTQQIVNYSKNHLPFNQWPTRKVK